MKKLLLSAVAALLTSVSLMAQVPEYMQYQTIVRNAQGQVLTNTEIGVKITITDDAEGSFVETHTVTTDEVGIALIKIGSGSVSSQYVPIGQFFGSPEGIEKMMKVEIDPTGGTNYSLISGESQLLTVPYAFRANTSTTADEANIAGYASTANEANTANTATTASKANAVGDLKLAKARITIQNQSSYNFDVNIGGKTARANAGSSNAVIELDLLTYTPVYCSLVSDTELYDAEFKILPRISSTMWPELFLPMNYMNRTRVAMLIGPFTNPYNASDASSINTATITIQNPVN